MAEHLSRIPVTVEGFEFARDVEAVTVFQRRGSPWIEILVPDGRVAVFVRTGAVHRVEPSGVVEEEPIKLPAPPTDPQTGERTLPTDEEAGAEYERYCRMIGLRSSWDQVDPEIRERFKRTMAELRR